MTPGTKSIYRAWFAVFLSGATPAVAAAQPAAPPVPPAAQNPSPMVEHTRKHERLTPVTLAGVVDTLAGPDGKPVLLYRPRDVTPSEAMDLVIHFHGDAWLPIQAVASRNAHAFTAVVNLGAGSGVYARAFKDPAVFDSLLSGLVRAASARGVGSGAGRTIRRLTLVGFSAGHGAIREILREPRHFARVDAVLLLDGMHTSYVPEGTVVEKGGVLDSTSLVAFEAFARAAMQGSKRFLVTHSEIFPGTFASTTEAADWLIAALGLSRTPVLAWGPRGMQQLSEIRAGRFEVMGFAGNAGPDHIDQFHAMPEMVGRLWR